MCCEASIHRYTVALANSDSICLTRRSGCHNVRCSHYKNQMISIVKGLTSTDRLVLYINRETMFCQLFQSIPVQNTYLRTMFCQLFQSIPVQNIYLRTMFCQLFQSIPVQNTYLRTMFCQLFQSKTHIYEPNQYYLKTTALTENNYCRIALSNHNVLILFE